MEKKDKVLVTGANGMLGRAVCQELEDSGIEKILKPSRQELDLTNESSVHNYIRDNKPDYIFHLASVVYGLKGNLNNQLESLIENTKIYSNVLTACGVHHKPKKIFFAGTVASYAYPYKSMPLKEEFFFDGLPHAGEFGYAMAKRHAYAYLELLRQKFDIQFVYGLLTNLYGEHDTFDIENGHVVPSLICKAVAAIEKGEPNFTVWGNPRSTRDFLYIRDAATAAIHCMNRGQGLINICSGKSVSMKTLAETISHCLDNIAAPIWDPNQPVGIQNRDISASRLSELGFKARHELEQGIRNSITWHQSNK